MLLDLKNQIALDKKFKRYKEIVEMNYERINPTNLVDEIRDVAEIRTKTTLSKAPRTDLLKHLIDENLRAQAYRSRLSEICVQCARVSAQLTNANDKIKDWISIKYGEELKQCGRTKDERMVVINALLRPSLELVKSLELVTSMALVIIQDIDKQHYSLKLTVDSLNIHVTKEHLI